MSTHAGKSFPEALTQAPLRQLFTQDPGACTAGVGLDPQVQRHIAALDAGSLERQAQSLIGKRRSEVAALLPETFARFLRTQGLPLCRRELNRVRLRLQLRGRSWTHCVALHAVYCRVRSGHMRPVIQLLCSWRGQCGEHVLYLF